MNEQQRRLAERLVVCPGWRWMPGMLTEKGQRLEVSDDALLEALPDLSDPATLGCLLSLVCRFELPEVEALVEGLERVACFQSVMDQQP